MELVVHAEVIKDNKYIAAKMDFIRQPLGGKCGMGNGGGKGSAGYVQAMVCAR